MLVQCCLLGYSATLHSPTTLEPGFLVSGLSHCQFERFELFRVNPPLVRVVAAAPVHLIGYTPDWTRYYDSPGSRAEFSIGDDFIRANGTNSIRLLTYARWACIPFSLVGSYIAFRWSRELYGYSAGIFTLTLYVFEPNLLAHGELITSDAACTTFGLLAGYTFWKWLEQPNFLTAFYAGLSMGLAELTKMTWLILFGLWPLVWGGAVVYQRYRSINIKQESILSNQSLNASTNPFSVAQETNFLGSHYQTFNLKNSLIQLILIILIALYVLNLGYLFDGTGTRLKNYSFVSTTLTGHKKTGSPGNRFKGSLLGELPVPVPKQYLLGLDSQKKDFESFNHPSYLMGEWQAHGWWYYYLYGFFVKIPCGIWGIIIAIFACRVIKNNGIPDLLQKEFVLLAMILSLLIVISSQTGFSRHFRYALPVIGLLTVFLGQAAQINIYGISNLRSRSITKFWFGMMLTYTVVGTLLIYPHQLAFFNDFVGGPEKGHHHLLGSSNYWGQDLLILREWADQNQLSVSEFISSTDQATFEVLFPQNDRINNLSRKIIVTNSEHLFGQKSKLKLTGERIGYTLWVVK